MAGRLLSRLGQAALAAWGIASLVFILSRLALSSPEQLSFNGEGDLSSPTAGAYSRANWLLARQNLRHRLGLDEPLFYVTRTADAGHTTWQWHGARNQYHYWLTGLLHGQLGNSYRDGQPVTTLLRAALAYTLPLAGLALALVLGAATILALVLAAARAEPSGWRAGLRLLLVTIQALPMFALALGLLLCFANPDFLNILPAYSLPTLGADFDWQSLTLPLVLPLSALVLASLPELTLTLEAASRHEAHTDYATTALAKGLPPRRLLIRHLLPNALLPSLTTLADLLPTLLAGTVVVETLFAVPGMGRLLAEAAAAHDYPVVVGGVLLAAVARLVSLLLADILVLLAGPRIRGAL